MNTTIQCDHINKWFEQGDQRVKILKDISFDAHEGEIIMLMGPSGSGKTTLLSILGGITQQNSGTCTILGTNMNKLPSDEKTIFRAKNIGFMFQNFTLIPTLTIVENTAIPLLLKGIDRQHAFDQAIGLLTQLGLEKQLYRLPNQLSGGEQQRVAIARACIHKPAIILCDEPTSNLDHDNGKKIMEILLSIKNENKCTIIIVTHDPRIIQFADTIFQIEDGELQRLNAQQVPTTFIKQ